MQLSVHLNSLPTLAAGRNPATYRIKGCVGPKTSPDVLLKLKISYRCQDSNPKPYSAFPDRYTGRVIRTILSAEGIFLLRKTTSSKHVPFKTIWITPSLKHCLLLMVGGGGRGGCPLLWLFNLLIKTIKKSLCCMAEEPITVLPMQTL